jgi:type I restriction enzyme S subunit
MKMLGDDWAIVPFGKLVENKDSKRVPLKESDRTERHGAYPYYGASGIIDYVNDYLYEGTHLLIGEDGANLLAGATPIAFLADGKFWVNNHAHVLAATDRAELKYLQYFFETLDLKPYVTGSAQQNLLEKSLIESSSLPIAYRTSISSRL